FGLSLRPDLVLVHRALAPPGGVVRGGCHWHRACFTLTRCPRGGSMLETEAQREVLELALARTRAELARSLGQLKPAVQHELKLGYWAGRYPFTALGIAFGVGFLLGRR